MQNQTKFIHNKFNSTSQTRRLVAIHLSILASFMLLTGVLTIKLGQDVNWDLFNYHYSNPHALVANTTLEDIGISGIESYENPLRDLPTYLLMSNLSPKQAGFILGASQGVNLYLVFALTLVLLRGMKLTWLKKYSLGIVIAVFTLFGAGFNSEVGTIMGDATTSVFVLLALLLLLLSKTTQHKIYNVNLLRLTSFLIIGLGVGLKLTNVSYAIGLFVAGLVLLGWPSKKWFKTLSIDLTASAVGVAISGGLWYLKMWLAFGNPIFPFYNAVFKSPYYYPENFVDKRWSNSSILESILEPFSYVKHQAISSEVPFKDPRLAVMLIMIFALIITLIFLTIRGKKLKEWSILHTSFLLFVLTSYLVWAIKFSYHRYLIPIELVSLVVVSLCILLLIKKFWFASLAIIAIFLGITNSTIQTSWGRIAWQPTSFGLTKSMFDHTEGATVLIAGYQPYGFVVPYLPESSQVLRVRSDLNFPEKGLTKMDSLLAERVSNSKAKHTPFFAIIADEEQKFARDAFMKYGLKTIECNELPVTIRAHIPNKYRICNLEQI